MFIPVTLYMVAIMATLITVSHAGARLLILTLLALAALALWAGRMVHRADAVSDRMRKRGRRGLLAFLLTAVGACRPQPVVAPEPAEVVELDCGVRTCSIGQAGGSTVVWVSE